MASVVTENVIRDCYQFPQNYKLCSQNMCVPVSQHCPCDRENETRCLNGRCVPRSFLCNQKNDCGDNTDELDCQVNGIHAVNIPASVVVGLSVGSCLIFLLVIFIILYARRQSHLKSDAESGEQWKKYISNDFSSKTNKTSRTSPHKKTDVTEVEETKQDLLAKRCSIGSFGEGLLCTSTPKMSARQLDTQFVFDPLSPIVKPQRNKNNNNSNKDSALYAKVT
ncbi:hypothetical protein ScPMuIL_000127 [Solemya velum]